ncbi:MAG: TMEM165/GDT1 family protein [bacterium]|nr:TMEM165/GDT1 family protein [bacterium]
MIDLLSAFGIVFVAELGDKTQLAAAGFATRYRVAPVVAGMCAGYVVVSTISAVIGGSAGNALPTSGINLAAGILFIAVGAFGIWSAGRSDDSSTADPPKDDKSLLKGRYAAFSVAASVASAIIVAELGDKTMLATIALAARNDALMVWIGATLGICAAGLLAVALGRALARRLPSIVIRRVGGLIFVAAGIAVLVVGA